VVPGLTGTLWGNCSWWVALRREQQEWLESKHWGKTEPQEGRWDWSQTLQAQPLEGKKWQYVCRPFRTNSLKEEAMWRDVTILISILPVSELLWTFWCFTRNFKNTVLYQCYAEIKYVEYRENILGRMTTFKRKVMLKSVKLQEHLFCHERKTSEVLFMLHVVLSEHECVQVPT
jgi:hypothetical protein